MQSVPYAVFTETSARSNDITGLKETGNRLVGIFDYHKLTSESNEKRPVAPRRKSLMRGCVCPHRHAASSCVQLLLASRRWMRSISMARAC
ncbi:MAG: hypothetical protein QM739_00950 [Propionivibrio sp.]